MRNGSRRCDEHHGIGSIGVINELKLVTTAWQQSLRLWTSETYSTHRWSHDFQFDSVQLASLEVLSQSKSLSDLRFV